MRNILQHQNVT